MRICSPHCGIDPETTSGGETYERELLGHLAGEGVRIDILLARHQRHPEGVANWTIHRLPIGRGLRWPVAALLLPPVIKRVWAEMGLDGDEVWRDGLVNSPTIKAFNRILFTEVLIPRLQRLGLMSSRVEPRYREIGLVD